MTTNTDFQHAHARKQFEAETTEHEMTVLHDDGLYRHLRFQKPGTGIWHFDLITWPGHLTISGDIGDGWTFARIPDMFDFFRPIQEPWRVNADYWWEKMPQQLRAAAKTFDDEAYQRIARQNIIEWDLDAAEVDRALAKFDAGFDDTLPERDEQYRYVEGFRFTGDDGRTHEFSDVWEWDVDGWNHHYLLALFAIVWGIERYKVKSGGDVR